MSTAKAVVTSWAFKTRGLPQGKIPTGSAADRARDIGNVSRELDTTRARGIRMPVEKQISVVIGTVSVAIINVIRRAVCSKWIEALPIRIRSDGNKEFGINEHFVAK